MLSPIGVNEKPEDFDVEKIKFGRKNNKSPNKAALYIGKKAWANKWSPFGIMRKAGKTIGSKMVKKYVNKRMAHLPEEEREALQYYLYQIFMREGSTEYALFVCFTLGMYPVNSVGTETRLRNPDYPLPISFFYGDRDWTDHRAGERVV